MGAVKAALAGKADMGQVSAAVKAALAPSEPEPHDACHRPTPRRRRRASRRS